MTGPEPNLLCLSKCDKVLLLLKLKPIKQNFTSKTEALDLCFFVVEDGWFCCVTTGQDNNNSVGRVTLNVDARCVVKRGSCTGITGEVVRYPRSSFRRAPSSKTNWNRKQRTKHNRNTVTTTIIRLYTTTHTHTNKQTQSLDHHQDGRIKAKSTNVHFFL